MSETEFLRMITNTGCVWVAIGDGQALSFADNQGVAALPIWRQKADVQEFLSNIDAPSEIRAVEVPLDVFVGSWLYKHSMNISEFIINPNGISQRDLTLTREEFLSGIRH